MAKSGYKKQISYYHPLAFHAVRTFQFLSSGIVTAILFYFVYRLVVQKIALPWSYYFLQGAGLATLLYLTISLLVRCCRTINPIHNLIVNGFLFAIWSAAFGLLANAMRGTITRVCTKALWGNDTGVMVCVRYKVLFVFAGLGVVSSIAACLVDYKARQNQLARGKYVRANSPKFEENTAYKCIVVPSESQGLYQ
ncbi:hypothetical protein BP6252_13966 [Coleophoma cylindrospora]|uniref:MARVEL domain-containing protein n=1 Tax=Coleophoma cylindrospora TaxID=1849047 RepID=A0A3D8Q4P6_9HELO|nr:hypothetical protein BP6252_13966 [Coleophoma cylindrospora]